MCEISVNTFSYIKSDEEGHTNENDFTRTDTVQHSLIYIFTFIDPLSAGNTDSVYSFWFIFAQGSPQCDTILTT